MLLTYALHDVEVLALQQLARYLPLKRNSNMKKIVIRMIGTRALKRKYLCLFIIL